MSTYFTILYRLTKADVLERTRRYSFFVTMVATLYVGYSAYAGNIVLRLGNYRGVYNSAWVGMLMALSVVTIYTIAGFYIVKNAVERDELTRVGQILAATRISNFTYILSKLFSNAFILMSITGIMFVAGFAMQLGKSESGAFNLPALLLPFLLIALPAMFLTAGIALLFENISWLRGGFGNVFFIFFWATSIALPIENDMPAFDLTGLSLVRPQMQEAVRSKDPNYKDSFGLNIGPEGQTKDLKPVVWNGMQWTPWIIFTRLSWFAWTLLLAVISSLLFRRFDRALPKKKLSPA
ncbi:MAG TPA: hypothetical protein VKS81_08360 [Bacteroidota bacterium]|nr:hypothetical protein [Bacteroidota bacterium]